MLRCHQGDWKIKQTCYMKAEIPRQPIRPLGLRSKGMLVRVGEILQEAPRHLFQTCHAGWPSRRRRVWSQPGRGTDWGRACRAGVPAWEDKVGRRGVRSHLVPRTPGQTLPPQGNKPSSHGIRAPRASTLFKTLSLPSTRCHLFLMTFYRARGRRISTLLTPHVTP